MRMLSVRHQIGQAKRMLRLGRGRPARNVEILRRGRVFPGAGASLAVVLAAVLVAWVAPGVAQAAFVRPFLRQLANTCEKPAEPLSCPGSKPVPLAPGDLSVDGKDDVWVTDSKLAEFGPASEENRFLEDLVPGERPLMFEHLAIQTQTGDLYVTGTGAHTGEPPLVVYGPEGEKLDEWGRFSNESAIAIDDSPKADAVQDPSSCETGLLSVGECYVYVIDKHESGGLEKFNAKGQPQEFSASAPYIGGEHHNVIVGPGEGAGRHMSGVAVDPAGDIFVSREAPSSVVEYAPSGELKQEFNFQARVESGEMPRLDGQAPSPGIHGGLAVDPVSHHLLVAVQVEPEGRRVGAVYEFEPGTGRFVARITEAQGVPFGAPSGLAVDSGGDVYVADAERGSVSVFAAGHFLPTVAVGGVSGRTGVSAVLNGSVNPEGFKLTQCRFEYAPEAEWAKEGFAGAGARTAECEPAAGGLPLGGVSAVSAGVSGLTAGTAYRYRLQAHSEGELGGTSQSEALAFTAPGVPVIESSSVANVSSTSADLRAGIDPRGAATSYRFEYDTREYAPGEAAHGVRVPVPDASIGSGGPTGSSSESVLQHAGSLTPGTTYFYRVFASNAAGAESGVGGMFTTLPQATVGLPDGRAYELVTPADKGGASDMFAEPGVNGHITNAQSTGTPSLDGAGFMFETRSAFGPFPGAFVSQYVFHRVAPVGGSGGGWTYTSLASPSLGVQAIGDTVTLGSQSFGVSDPRDLSRVAFMDGVGSEVGEAGVRPMDLVGAPGGPYSTLHVDPPFDANENLGGTAVKTKVVGGSRDLAQIVLQSNSNTLCPGAKGAGTKVEEGEVLCEWDGGYETLEDGELLPQLSLVNLAPGSQSKPASTCGAYLGGGTFEEHGGTHGAVSADGGAVFFTAPEPFKPLLSGPGCWNGVPLLKPGLPVHAPQLYARVRESEPSGEVVHDTLKVSAPEAGVTEEAAGVQVPPREYPAQYIGASEDGSKVFFLTETELTQEAAELHLHDPELYECEIVTHLEGETVVPGCVLTRLAAGASGFQAAYGTATLTGPEATGAGTLTAGIRPGHQSHDSDRCVPRRPAHRTERRIRRRQRRTKGIPPGTTITAVGSETLTLSAPATVTSPAPLYAGSGEVTGLTTKTGAFRAGEDIEGAGLQAGTTITAVNAGTLSLSEPATQAGSGVGLRSGDPKVDFVPAVSADGSAVYFTAFGALAAGATRQTPPHDPGLFNGREGEVNLYRYDTATGTTSYVATVDTAGPLRGAELRYRSRGGKRRPVHEGELVHDAGWALSAVWLLAADRRV